MLKKIVLLGASIDALGRFADAGTELDVIADDGAGAADTIRASKAQELIDQHRAVSKSQADEMEKREDPPINPNPPVLDPSVDPEPQGKRGK